MSLDDQLRRTMTSLTDRIREEAERQIAALTTEFGQTIKAEREAAAAQASADARSTAQRDLAERLNVAAAAAAAHEQEAIAAAVAAVKTREHQAQAEAVAAAESREREAVAKAVAAVEARERAAAVGAVAAAVAGAEAKARDALAAAEARVGAAREAGRAEGFATGKAEGEETGRAEGHREGLEEGLKDGRVEGRMAGREEGREEGRLEGKRAGQETGFKEGRRVGREEGRKEALAEDVEKARVEGQHEATDAARQAAYAECRAAELAANVRLLEAIRALDAARSLTEVLDALASSAGREAARVAVLLVRGGTLRGWRWTGFGAALDERHDFPVPAAEAGVIAEAARMGVAVSVDSGAAGSAPAFAELPPGREVLAVPVQMSGQVIAVLYADQGIDRTSASLTWPATLEVLARHAARSLESMTAFRAAQLLTERPDISSRSRPAARTLADGDESLLEFRGQID